MFSQNIKGKIYDAESTAKGIKIYNLTQNSIAFSNEKGEFNINASVNDSLSFQSLFHEPKTLIVKPQHLKEILVIELKKTVNELDVVHIKKEAEAKPFEEKTYNQNLQKVIQKGIKENPHLYGKMPNTDLDIIAVVGLIIKLFKKKKPPVEAFVPITFMDLESLFKTNRFFNTELLTDDLKIPPQYINLFFDFCDAKQIDAKLLSKKNQFMLLEQLVNRSIAFLKLIEDAETGN